MKMYEAQTKSSDVGFRCCFLIVLYGIVLRIPGLFGSFWGDELCAIHQAEGTVVDAITYQATKGGHPPLYYILLNLWSIGGTTEVWVRALSMAFGAASIVAIIKIGATYGGRRAGIAAGLFACVCYSMKWPSHEARNYVLYVCFGLWAWWALLRAVRTQKYRYWGLFAVFLSLGIYSFYFAFYVAAATLVLLLFEKPQRRSFVGYGVAAMLTIVFIAPWALALRSQLTRTTEKFSAREVPPPAVTITGSVKHAMRSGALHGPWNPIGHGIPEFLDLEKLPLTEIYLLAVILILSVVFSRKSKDLNHQKLEHGILACLLFGITFLVLCEYTSISGRFNGTKYSCFFAGIACVGCGLLTALTTGKRNTVIVVVLIALLTPFSIAQSIYRRSIPWREVVAEIDMFEGAEVTLITSAARISKPYIHYSRQHTIQEIVRGKLEVDTPLAQTVVCTWLCASPLAEKKLDSLRRILFERGYQLSVDKRFGKIRYLVMSQKFSKSETP